ncbi:3-methyladenine DNA glycosylase [Antrihabitans sp. YC2-6]|uniref:3-methyladenine DNA glycosylase n=1 Tax=Antrihabitans sp. YC2-6 TaxID=2799498 RepID=UPI0018F29771|nr:3-methyladenine DNA glycosylase [Antrihabitans sp. YC2-6]MBJ8348496.1 3-methyladenine DNA glycosylase [Antrihabitans sp. YC2-6]
MQVLPESEWRVRRERHRESVSALIGPHVQRHADGKKHPVIDFLFTYYSHRPAQLLRWHPGFGVVLENADEYPGFRGYCRTDEGATADPAFLERRRSAVEFTARLLELTAARPANLSCFGLHEWAMVYKSEEVRHSNVALRLGHDGTDAVVESMSLRCTHYDAFRFFTPAALPRNVEVLTREHQVQREQPGCLHATMDLYKWCFKLTPFIDSEFTLDCFRLALDARELDMRASPYDLTEYGYSPVRIETSAGRAEYARAQTAIAARGADLRAGLFTRCRELLADTTTATTRTAENPN